MRIKILSQNFYHKKAAVIILRFLKKSKNIIVTGGSTVLPIYKELSRHNLLKKNFFLSDERLVDLNSKVSNYKKLKNFKIFKKNKFFFFKTYKKKKLFYIKKKQTPINDNVKYDLSILTIGEKSHIASIFFSQLKKVDQIYFKYKKIRRVSIPLSFIKKSKTLIFLCPKKDRAIEFKKNLLTNNFFNFFKKNNSIILFSEESYNYFKNYKVFN